MQVLGVGSYVKVKNGGSIFLTSTDSKTNGLFQNQAEVDNYVNSEGVKYQPTAKPGDVRLWITTKMVR